MKINDNGTDRNMTETEITEHETRQKTCADEAKATADALAARTVAREALLDKLGITAEEAQLLLGGM